MMNDTFNNQKFRVFSTYQMSSLRNKKILIAVGSLGISGGTNIILEYAAALQQIGAKVILGHMLGSKEDIRWHPRAEEFEIQDLPNLRSSHFDLGIATWWRTAYEIVNIPCVKYLYFVQSLESRFALNDNDTNTEALIAATYHAGFPIITIASWMQNMFMVAGCGPVWQVKNGIDKEIFGLKEHLSEDQKDNKKLKVLVEGAMGVPMKAIEETLESLSTLTDLVEISYVNPNPANSEVRKFESVQNNYNNVPLNEMSSIYGTVDLLVKMSRVEGMFGPPLEAFHAGATAIVSKVTGYDEYIKHGHNALVVEVNDFSGLNDAILWLAQNRATLNQLKIGAAETAKNWPSINDSAMEFASICRLIVDSENVGNSNKIALKEIEESVLSLISNNDDPWSILNTVFKSGI